MQRFNTHTVRARSLLLGLAIGCGGETDEPLDPFDMECPGTPNPECPCGGPLQSGGEEEYRTFDRGAAELRTTGCNSLNPPIIGECSDGKRFLHIDGGFGHTTRYYASDRLVGVSSSSDLVFTCCPANRYAGRLEDVTCDVVTSEPLCSTANPGLPPYTIPYADGQLYPWCDPHQ